MIIITRNPQHLILIIKAPTVFLGLLSVTLRVLKGSFA